MEVRPFAKKVIDFIIENLPDKNKKVFEEYPFLIEPLSGIIDRVEDYSESIGNTVFNTIQDVLTKERKEFFTKLGLTIENSSDDSTLVLKNNNLESEDLSIYIDIKTQEISYYDNEEEPVSFEGIEPEDFDNLFIETYKHYIEVIKNLSEDYSRRQKLDISYMDDVLVFLAEEFKD